MKSRFDLQTLLGLILVAAAGAILYVLLGDPPKKPAAAQNVQPSARTDAAQAAVNKHLEMTAQQMDLQRKRMELEKAKIMLEESHSPQTGVYQAPTEGRDLHEDPQVAQMVRDLNLDRKTIASSPEDLIQQQLYQEARQHEMDKAARDEYARQFVENARRGGYEVILDDDLHVLSAKPIRNPARQYPVYDNQ